MSVQFKINIYFRSEINQYECMLNFINTRDHDISIKKEISENISYRIFQTLSHEFGTYMNIISNITENALEDDRISIDLKKDYFRIINTNSILLENVVKDMRDFFSIMNQKLEVQIKNINLKESVFQTLELFKKQLQLKKLKTQIKIQKGIESEIMSDESFIKQILSNFISNSLKFTLQGYINIYLFKESEKYIRLEVEDSGIGMSSEECERLKGMLKNGFSDQKISKNSVGLGFGLLVSNNLARLIGNSIKKQAIYFDSSPQGGSRFWILIRTTTNPNQKQKSQKAVFQKISIFSEKQMLEPNHKRKSNIASIENKLPLQKENQLFQQDQNIEESLSNDFLDDSFKQELPRNILNQNSIGENNLQKKNKPNLTVQTNHSLKDVKQIGFTQKTNIFHPQQNLQDQSEMDSVNQNSKIIMNQDTFLQKETKHLEIIQNLSSKSNSPLKSSFSIKQQRRKGSAMPILSLESSQMVNSKIIQLRSRVRHTIVNKLTKTTEQIEAPLSMANEAINNTFNKIFSQQFKNLNLTQEGSNAQSNNQRSPYIPQTPQSVLQWHQQLQFLNSSLSQGNHLNMTNNQSPQKVKDNLLAKSQSQNTTLLGNLNFHTQNIIKTSNEFDQKQFQINSLNEQDLKISQEKVFNYNPLTKTIQNINTRNIINSKIEEEQIEDDTKQQNSLQYSSENYSSSLNDNNSSSAASKSSHNIYQKIKTKKINGFKQLFEEKLKKNQSILSQQKQKGENKKFDNQEQQEHQKQSQALSQADKNNLSISQLEDSIQSLSNSSTSFQQMNQRDQLEYQEYQFNENLSLDDLDAINNLDYRQNNQKQDFYGQHVDNKNISYLNHKKNSLSQNTAAINTNNNSYRLENFLEDFQFTQTKTLNDINSPQIKKKKHSIQETDHVYQVFEEDLEIDELESNNNNCIPIQKSIQKMIDLNQASKKTPSFLQKCDQEKSNIILVTKQNISNSHTMAKYPQKINKSSSQEHNAVSFGIEDKFQFNIDSQQFLNNSLESKQNLKNSQIQKQVQKQKNLKQQLRFQYPKENLINQQNAQHQIDQNQYQSIYSSQINQENIFKKQFTSNNIPTCTMSNLNVDEHEINSPVKIKAYQRKSQDTTQPVQQQKKILLVDDEIFNIFSLKLIFQKFGLSDNILEAYNGQQAIQVLLNQQNKKQIPINQEGYQIGMIIMDVNMPIMNGIECTKYIRELENNNLIDYSPNIIGYTAYSDSQTRNMCFDAGMDDLLLKPSRRDDFIAIIEKYFLSS
ncbi:response regulator receiver domain protein (macronuclear) [Tetrahymena thermophila SB210]|uniref:Response regulator receiver domain protein n=1 Tax=Tetrahymena thermophila (strain SB210) TaxID=312017 RepID=I7LTI8_TETTS|nr:response regulator receiver domain protein [Tetrahymena thermophila SB210]EAR85325.2 response regulator receiver domain protein [Tetrahymena thermophila SB210]|eukprot:XP_001032988.2 response regulator receiver domain protein [Tetrahymena thermophila SB210]